MTTSQALELAPSPSPVRLPLEVVTEACGWVGNRGSGKTYGAKVAAELMLRADAQVVVLDPVDAWWGLRYGRERGASGLPVYVFGGIRGDLPLEETAGALLADVVVERGVSAVLSLRKMNRRAQRAFARDFLDRLYLRKGEEQYRSPVHVVVEEAHTFAPQTIVAKDDVAGACLAAVQDVALMGRSSGLGISLVTQRVASVAKSVLELVEVLFAFRTTGPNARKALRLWFDAHDDDGSRLEEFERTVQKLKRGECWAWSPGLLDLFVRAKIREAETFDSSSTPKPGQRPAAPRGKAAELDLDALGEQMEETRQEVEARDPVRLQKRVVDLEGKLAPLREEAARHEAKIAELEERVVEPVEVKVPVLDEALVLRLEAAAHVASTAVEEYRERAKAVDEAALGVLEEVRSVGAHVRTAVQEARLAPEPAPRALPAPREDRLTAEDFKLDHELERTTPAPPRAVDGLPTPDFPGFTRAAERKVLAVLLGYPEGRTPAQAAIEAGYAEGGGGFQRAVTFLVRYGLAERRDGRLVATAGGRHALPDAEPLPRGKALVDHWNAKLKRRAEREVLRVLLEAYPEALAPAMIANRARTQDGEPYELDGGGFQRAVGLLKRLGLALSTGGGKLHAADVLVG